MKSKSIWLCMLLSSLCLAGMLWVLKAASSPQHDRVDEAIEMLLKEAEKPTLYLQVPESDPRLKAIEKLKSIGTPKAVKGLLQFLTKPYADRKLKQHALTALGQIGTPEAVQAIKQFEEWAENRRLNPPPFRFGMHDDPSDHFSPLELKPKAQVKGKDNFQWAIFKRPYPTWVNDWWVTRSKDEKVWEQPILVGPSEEPETLLRQLADGERSLGEFTKDGDGDGLSDLLEQRIGTNPSIADTDNDGVIDGHDGNPLTPKHKPSEITEIRQAVFTVLFATCNSRDVLLIVDKDDIAKQEYYGFAGWVIPVKSIREGWVNITAIKVKVISSNIAEAEIEDYEGPLAASGHEAKLEKKHGKWVVVEFYMTWIS